MRGPKPQLAAAAAAVGAVGGGNRSSHTRSTGTKSKSSTHKSHNTKKSAKSSNNNNNKDAYLEGLNLVQRGNEYFFSDCFLEATGYYYQAAMMLSSSSSSQQSEHQHAAQRQRSKAWSNMAECHLRLQNWEAAQDACNHAIDADATNQKALYRRAKARFELSDYVGAAQDAQAVGTEDAQNVAELCRELAKDSTTTASSGNNNPANKSQEANYPPQRRGGSYDSLGTSSSSSSLSFEEERDLWFRRIIDSYRLRVDDEYTRTGASDAGSLYGIRVKGGTKPPIDHFKAYVRRAVKKRLLPDWFSGSEMMTMLCQMATTDDFSNINQPVMPEEIMEFYEQFFGAHKHHHQEEEVQQLRDLATFVEGPIGMPWRNDNNPKVLAEPGASPPPLMRTTHKPRRSSTGNTPRRMKSREHSPHTPTTSERRHVSRSHRSKHQYDYDPALMDKNSPYGPPPHYASMRSSNKGSRHARSQKQYTPEEVEPKYEYNIRGGRGGYRPPPYYPHHTHHHQHPQQQPYPYTPVSEKRQQQQAYYPRTPVSEQREAPPPPTMPMPPPLSREPSSYETQQGYLYHHHPQYSHPHQHPNVQGNVQAAWGSFHQEDAYERVPSPVLPSMMSEKTPKTPPQSHPSHHTTSHKNPSTPGSYGPQLPAPYYGGGDRHERHHHHHHNNVPMMPYHHRQHLQHSSSSDHSKYYPQQKHYYDSRDPENEYYNEDYNNGDGDERDDSHHQNVIADSISTTQEVRHGYSGGQQQQHFQVFSDLTELSP